MSKSHKLIFSNNWFLYIIGCENLKDALTKINDGFNNSDTADLCICTDDIHSKTDVWQEV